MSTNSSAPTASASSVPTASRGQYTAKQLFELQIAPSAIAGDTSQIYVAEVALGARQANTLSKVVVVSRNGGAPALVPGSDTPAGVSINGLAIFANALYLSEASNGSTRDNGVYRLVSGTATPVAGGPGAPAGLNQGNGDGGPALSAALQGPAGIAFSKAGDLYIAEAGDSRVRVVRGQTITTYAGGNGCAGDINAAPTGTATTATFCVVGLIAVDSEGAVYAAQAARGKWIARIDPSGAVSTISNSFAVNGLAVDVNGDLLAADVDGHRVVRFPRADPGQPIVVTTDVGTIVALAVGPEGSIYVAHWLTPTPTAPVTYWVTRLVPSP